MAKNSTKLFCLITSLFTFQKYLNLHNTMQDYLNKVYAKAFSKTISIFDAFLQNVFCLHNLGHVTRAIFGAREHFCRIMLKLMPFHPVFDMFCTCLESLEAIVYFSYVFVICHLILLLQSLKNLDCN